MFVAGILALVMQSARMPGIIMLVVCVITLVMGGFAGIIGIILGLIGGILAVLAAPKEAPAA